MPRYDLGPVVGPPGPKGDTGPQGPSGGLSYGVGHGLKVVNNDLTVNSVDDFNGDNTLPMTAAGVQTTVGNIEALLATI